MFNGGTARVQQRTVMQRTLSLASEPKALRDGLRPRRSPYKRQLSYNHQRGFAKPSLPHPAPSLQKLRPLQPPLGLSSARDVPSRGLTSHVARMASACQHDHASTFEPPASLRNNLLLHRKLARPALLTLPSNSSSTSRKLGPIRPTPLPQLAASAPSAAAVSHLRRMSVPDASRDLRARDRKASSARVSSAPLCRRPIVPRRAAPPSDILVAASGHASPSDATAPITRPLSTVSSASSAARASGEVARPTPIELPSGDDAMQIGCTPPATVNGVSGGGGGGGEGDGEGEGEADGECEGEGSPTSMRDFSPAVSRPSSCLSRPPDRIQTHAQMQTHMRDFSPPVLRPSASAKRSFAADPSPPPPPSEFSPPVLRSKSLQGVPSSLQDAPASLSASEPARGGGPRVKLVYDQVLNCYFDPVSHRYFELR